MTFLPIVGRELRVAARRRGTYRVRLAIALLAMLLGGVVFLVNLGAPQHQLGRHIFEGLSVLSIIYGLLSGRISTADCLSEEKREGTLGLLFLTDLKGHDVVLGKLVATSLSAFYGLLAGMPVLAIPLLLGGITHGEFWRCVLVLVNTSLFSLAIGMFGSALSRDARRAMAANLALGLLLMAGLPACAGAVIYFAGHTVTPEAFLACPVYGLYLCDDGRYAAGPQYFWQSLGVIHGLTWLLLALTSWLAPRTWQDKPAVRKEKTTLREIWHAWSYGTVETRSVFRRRMLDVNAFYWLAGRARLKPIHVWTFLGLMAGWWIWSWLASGTPWFDPLTATITALILNSTLKLWLALEAGQQLAEDQKAGALELLLTTPLSVRDFLHGQLLALRRQFLGPLLTVMAIEMAFMIGAMNASPHERRIPATWIAGLVVLLTDTVALSFVAMRVALTARNLHRAVLSTISRILILPWIGFGMGVGLALLWAELFSDTGWSPDWKFYLSLWFALGIFTDLVFGLMALRQLLRNFRELATDRFAPRPSLMDRWLKRRKAAAAELAAGRSAKKDQPVARAFPRFPLGKKTFLAGAALGLILACVLFIYRSSRPHFPPIVMVSLTQSNAPLSVFPGTSVFLILPDGSLWRWGGRGPARAVVPERIGTNSNWAHAFGMSGWCVGIQKDGTLWQWGRLRTSIPAGRFANDPEQVDPGHDWINASTGGGHSVALKSDGTLWAWGDNSAGQLGNGPGPNSIYPVQVGTNRDWSAASCQGPFTLALRTNGTLWLWGRVYSFAAPMPTANAFPNPTQVCRETNWAGVSVGWGDGAWAWTRSGDMWLPNLSSPNAQTAVSVTGQLIASNYVPNHVITAYCGTPKLYDLRADGTLWEKTHSLGAATSADKWRQIGKRSDWVGIWGVWGTAIGLTADGTIWTWGIDQSRDPTLAFSDKLKLIQTRIRRSFGSPPPGPITSPGPMPPYQKEPRPLMRIVPP